MFLHYKHYISGLLLLLLASCSEQQLMEDPTIRSPYEAVEISAGMPQTRMTTEEENRVLHFLWEKGDLITLATASQQLPYVADNSGAATTFHSAYGSAAKPDDFLKDVEGSVVYARYPYNNKAPINMDSLTTLVASGSPFLYAVDTIREGKLNLHYHHAMAYLRFHVKHDPFPTDRKLDISASMDLGWSSSEDERMIIRGKFDYETKSIIPIETSNDIDIPYVTFMDSLAVFPISPVKSATDIMFMLYCRSTDENQEEYYFMKDVMKEFPEGGLQAGHVYDVYLDFRDNQSQTVEVPQFLIDLYNSTNGQNWTNNTNWLTDAPLSEWYGITTDDEGNVSSIDLSDNNLTGHIVNLEFPATLESFAIANSAIDSLSLTGTNTQIVRLDNSVTQYAEISSVSRIEAIHCFSTLNVYYANMLSINNSQAYEITGYGIDEVRIQDCTMRRCAINPYVLIIENSEIEECISIPSQWLYIINSTCRTIGWDKSNTSTQIELENANLIHIYDLSGNLYFDLNISNLTRSLTGAEWDRFILYTVLSNLYYATNGDNWTDKTNWLSDRPFSEWYGITEDGNGNIAEINLSDNGLVGKEVYINLPVSLTSFAIDNSAIDSLEISGFNNNTVRLFNCAKKYAKVYNVDNVEALHCKAIELTVNSSKALMIMDSEIEKLICDPTQQLTINFSSCKGVGYGKFNDDMQISLQGATIIEPYDSNYKRYNGLTISNVTCTLTGAEWDAFIQSYLEDDANDTHDSNGDNTGAGGGASQGE